MQKIEKDVMINGSVITKDIEAAASQFANKEYKEFGFTLATALDQACAAPELFLF